jgi:Concanavalin A-like lectin/glucanases superfamily
LVQLSKRGGLQGTHSKATGFSQGERTNYGINVNANFLGFGLYYNDPAVTGDDFDIAGSPFEASRLLPIPAPGEFHHFAGTYRQVTSAQVELQMFVDGQLVKTKTLPGNLTNTVNDVPVTLGASAAEGELFEGILDEVSLYNRALSAAEIQAIFNAGSAGKCKDGAAIEVLIDIKPASFPNSINPKSKGKIPVAILTTDASDNTNTFDATTVDPLTVRFGSTSSKAASLQDALEDVDGDGDTDLILHFNTQDTGIKCGDTSATLTGETFGGQAIRGTDSSTRWGVNEGRAIIVLTVIA